jgi:hypothetical protein
MNHADTVLDLAQEMSRASEEEKERLRNLPPGRELNKYISQVLFYVLVSQDLEGVIEMVRVRDVV